MNKKEKAEYRDVVFVALLRDKLKQNKIHKYIYANSHDEMPYILMEEANYKRLLRIELSKPLSPHFGNTLRR